MMTARRNYLLIIMAMAIFMVLAGCEADVEPEDEADGNGNNSEGSQLVVDVKAEGNLAAGGEVTYTFNVVAGTTYRIVWEDSYDHAAGSTYGADIEVSCYHQNQSMCNYSLSQSSSASYPFDQEDSGYEYDHYFVAATSETISLVVNGWDEDESGSFSIMVEEAGSAGESVQGGALAEGVGTEGTLPQNGQVTYTFAATAATVYQVSWEDSFNQASGSDYGADIRVSVSHAGQTSYYDYTDENETLYQEDFYDEDSGYTNDYYITPDVTETIVIVVSGYDSGDQGSFLITVEEAVVPDSSSTIALSEGAEVVANLTAGGTTTFTFSVTTGTNYRVIWEDSFQQASTSSYSADIKVSVYDESMTTLYDRSTTIGSETVYPFDEADSGYTTERYIVGQADETINIVVIGYNSATSSGTYSMMVEDVSVPDTSGY